MLFALVAPLLAATCSPDAPVRDHDEAPDGSTWVLSGDTDLVCWRATDDTGRDEVIARWRTDGARQPVAIEALPDGRAFLVMDTGTGWKLAVRSPTGANLELGITLPAAPTQLLAHPELPLVAIAMDGQDGTTIVWLVDVAARRVRATLRLHDEHPGMRFSAKDERLYVGGAASYVLDRDGVVIAAPAGEGVSDARR